MPIPTRRTRRSRNKIDSEPVWGLLLPPEARKEHTLQRALRMNLVRAILDRRIAGGVRLPSTRELASVLDIARITVALTYDRLVTDGYLESRERKGYFVALHAATMGERGATLPKAGPQNRPPDWANRFVPQDLPEQWLEKPRDWRSYKYPFVYGQVDASLFPLAEWRECSRIPQGVPDISGWASDAIDMDDKMLISEIQNRVLTKRGIVARPENILITLGSQMALFLIAEILITPGVQVAVEDPGYMDARNSFQRRGAKLIRNEVDEFGAIVGPHLKHCAYLYCTPSHQCPTGVTMTTERRLELLKAASRYDTVLIEDDYDAETQFIGQPSPALKAFDRSERVIYLGSFSKILFPGLRIGYLVAPPSVIEQARRIRRLMIRHAPLNNQRALAIFIAHGHYDVALARKRTSLQARSSVICEALRHSLPTWKFRNPKGGSALWLQTPGTTNVSELELTTRKRGILIERGDPFFHASHPPTNFLRLAYSSIPIEHIKPGIEALAAAVHQHERQRSQRKPSTRA